MYRFTWIVIVLLCSCTSALWHHESERVRLNGFYVNKEIGVLLVSTNEHGYIFHIDDETVEALILSRSITFRPSFVGFEINRNYEVTGKLKLALTDKHVTVVERKKLQELGFKRSELLDTLVLSINLNGERYVIDGEFPMEKLDDEYFIYVEQPFSFIGQASRIVATPVTIAFDAFVGVPAAFLLFATIGLASP